MSPEVLKPALQQHLDQTYFDNMDCDLLDMDYNASVEATSSSGQTAEACVDPCKIADHKLDMLSADSGIHGQERYELCLVLQEPHEGLENKCGEQDQYVEEWRNCVICQ